MSDKASAAVGDLYESVLDEQKWLPAMQAIHRLVGGHAAFHIIADPSTGAVARSEQVGVDPNVNKLYAIAAVLTAPRRARSTISTVEPYRAQVERWAAQGSLHDIAHLGHARRVDLKVQTIYPFVAGNNRPRISEG